ncbi:hypothetical protein AOLI_G00263620 [Acnodon oligacanthus]
MILFAPGVGHLSPEAADSVFPLFTLQGVHQWQPSVLCVRSLMGRVFGSHKEANALNRAIAFRLGGQSPAARGSRQQGKTSENAASTAAFPPHEFTPMGL